MGPQIGKGNGSANGGAGGAGKNVEAAAELSHALAHAGDAHAEARFVRLRGTVGGKLHAATEVDDFEGDKRIFLTETDFGSGAAGVALDIGETFLDNAEEGQFDGLRETVELGEEEELRVDGAALAEALGVFLQGGDETEIVEERRVEKIREGADFAGHLLSERTSLFEGVRSGLLAGLKGLAELSEAEVDGEDGLGETIVELAADAAALFVLKFEELGGELMDGALGVFHFGDVGKRGDDANYVAVSIELRHNIAKNPDNLVRRARVTKAENAGFNGGARAENEVNRPIFRRDVFTVLGDGHDTIIFREFANGGPFRDTKHAVSGGIGEFNAAVNAVKNNGNVEIADESAEAFFTFAESFGGTTLLGEIGNGNDDAEEFAGGGEFGDEIEEGPRGVGAVGETPSDEQAAEGLTGSDDARNRAQVRRNDGTIFSNSDNAEFRGGFADYLFEWNADEIDNRLVSEEDARVCVIGDDADMEVLNERAETLLAGAEDVFGFLAGSDIANNDESAGAGIELDEGSGHETDASLPGLGAEVELDVANVAGLGDGSENLGAIRGIDPKTHLAGSLAEGVVACVAREAGEAVVDLEVRAVGEEINAEGIGAGAEGGGKHLLGTAKSLFGAEQVAGDAVLLAIGEDETGGRTKNGSDDGKPTKKELFT